MESEIITAPEEGVLFRFTSPDGRWVDLLRTVFAGRLSIGPANSCVYTDVYDFQTLDKAIDEFSNLAVEWANEPAGWIRHLPSTARAAQASSSVAALLVQRLPPGKVTLAT